MYVNISKQIGDQAGTDAFACNVLLRASETTAGVRLKPICGARERIQKSFCASVLPVCFDQPAP